MPKKYNTRKILLYGGILLFLCLYTYHTFQYKPIPYEATIAEEYKAPTATPIPAINRSDAPKALFVRDTVLLMEDSTEEVIRKLGLPGRIAETEYNFSYYIYNNDYKQLLFVALYENKVVGFYTDALNFEYYGFRYGSTLDEVHKALDDNTPLSSVITKEISAYKVSVLMDELETGKVVGIYVLSNTVTEDDYSEDIRSQVEQMVYDLTNSARVRNGLEPLSWSSSAGQAARKHSINMSAANFFSHTDPSLRSPGDRLNAEGISYQKCGENIIAGYGSAILSCHGWYNSEGHRKNLLNTKFRYLGVGFAYDEDSHYKTYITQNFYR